MLHFDRTAAAALGSLPGSQMPLADVVGGVAGLAAFSSDGGRSSRRPRPLRQTPVSVAYRPVKRTEREGAQTGWFVTARVKLVPTAARASRLGVRVELLRPLAPRKSQRNWSE